MTELALVGIVLLTAGLVLLVNASRIEPAWFIAVGLAAMVFSNTWRYMGLPPSGDRALVMLGVGLVLLRGWREDRLRSLPLHPAHLVLAALVLYVVSSAAFTAVPDDEAYFAVLDKFGIIPFALFLVAPLAFRTAEQRNCLLIVFVSLGGYLSFIALCEALELRGLIFPTFINDEDVGIHYGRARGPLLAGEINGLALYACAVFGAVATRVWTAPAARLAAGAIAIACLVGIIFTVTRQAWLAAILASGLTLVVFPDLRRWALPAAVTGVIAVVLVLVLIPGFAGRADSRLSNQYPLWDRYNSNSAALRMVSERPLVGFGWYTFADAGRQRLRLARDYPLTTVDRPHNVFLSNAAELGLVAATLWLVTILIIWLKGAFAVGAAALGPWRPAAFAISACWLVISNFTPLNHSFANALLWLALGIGASAWMNPALAPVAWPAARPRLVTGAARSAVA